MPEVKVTVGGREYEVACQEGEESYLRAAAGLLDSEAMVLGSQAARLTESRVLLMSGLMLADKTAGMDDQVKALQVRLDEALARIEVLQARAPLAPAAVERVEVRVEVPVLPEGLLDTLDGLAGRAEALAAEAEERVAAA